MSHTVSTEEACAVDSQYVSSFFTIPIELRRAVYAYLFDPAGHHIQYVVGGDGVRHFRLTTCTAPTKSGEEERGHERYGRERNPDGQLFYPGGPIYKRRLLSSWGPHWMCEELACHFRDGEVSTQEAGDIEPASSLDVSSAWRVCKRM